MKYWETNGFEKCFNSGDETAISMILNDILYCVTTASSHYSVIVENYRINDYPSYKPSTHYQPEIIPTFHDHLPNVGNNRFCPSMPSMPSLAAFNF